MVVLGIYYRNSTIHGMNIVGTTTFGNIGINVSLCSFVNYKHVCHKGKIHAITYHGNVLNYTLYLIFITTRWVVWFSKFFMNQQLFRFIKIYKNDNEMKLFLQFKSTLPYVTQQILRIH